MKEGLVCSVPSKSWSRKAVEDFLVYECINEGSHNIKRQPMYLALRKNGDKGRMERLYKVEEEFILNFKTGLKMCVNGSHYHKEIPENIERYISYMLEGEWKRSGLPNRDRRIFILSKDQELPHNPRPPKHGSYKKYYTFKALVEGKEIVS